MLKKVVVLGLILLLPATGVIGSYYVAHTRYEQQLCSASLDTFCTRTGYFIDKRGWPVFAEQGSIDSNKLVGAYLIWLSIVILLVTLFNVKRRLRTKMVVAAFILAIGLQFLTHLYTLKVYNYDQLGSHGLPPFHKLGDGYDNPFYNVLFWLATATAILYLLPRLIKLRNKNVTAKRPPAKG
jgi:uncharacterized membrane protein (GlpM family)